MLVSRTHVTPLLRKDFGKNRGRFVERALEYVDVVFGRHWSLFLRSVDEPLGHHKPYFARFLQRALPTSILTVKYTYNV